MTAELARRVGAAIGWSALQRAERIGLLVIALGCAALGTLPLFAGPGYEYALACGLLLPVTVAISSALATTARRDGYRSALWRGLRYALLSAGLALLIAFAHALRVGPCTLWEGAWFFALGPGCGALLAGAWGAALGALLRPLPPRRRWALAALLAPLPMLAGIALSLGRFYTSPIIFAFDPFVGYFAGTLYDTVISGSARLLSYRLGSLASLIALFALARQLHPPTNGIWPRLRRLRPRNLGLFLLGAGFSLGVTLRGPELGHYQTPATISEALGARHDSQRCDVVHARELLPRDVALLGRECDAHVGAIEEFFAARGPAKIRVYLFASAEQKAWLMGAANTYIAKPWRDEIYLQAAGFPHPVLAHELAHVIAGAFAHGPFKVPGKLGGILPDPGRIEGIAVAAAPSDEADLSSLEWSKAMLDLNLLPPLDSLFGLGFLGQHSATAYTVAGAFMHFLRNEQGPEALRRWYGGESLEQASGASLSAWEERFHAFLGQITVSPAAMDSARAHFDRPSVFARRCPHEVDALQGEAAAALSRRDLTGAETAYRDLLELDPRHLAARLELGTCLTRRADISASLIHHEQLAADASLHPRERAAVLERLADLLLQRGEAARARELYQQVGASSVDEDELRELDVKMHAATLLEGASDAGSLGYDAIVALLIGDAVQGADWAVASAKLATWAASEPEQGIAHYLLGKNFLARGRWPEAREHLDRALESGLELPRVHTEALRSRLILACAEQDRAQVQATLRALLQLPQLTPARRAGVLRLAQRCGVASGAEAAHDEPPAVAAAPADARCPTEMALIPAGEFWAGSPAGEGLSDERPRFHTRVPDYCLDQTEVTAAAYHDCVSAGKCSTPHGKQITCNYQRAGREQHPINCVDHTQATAYCAAQGKRLPSEIEWEYAAKGGDEQRRFSWGSEPPEGRTCWNRGTSCRVKSYPAGAFGLFDMTGNVWEWTSSWFGEYPWPPVQSATVVYRGGSWSRRFEKWMLNTLRNRFTPESWGSHLGLRCAKLAQGAQCPFGARPDGSCAHGVIALQCPENQGFNGVRCAAPGEPTCQAGATLLEGHGCVSEKGPSDVSFSADQQRKDMIAITRSRSPQFDADCQRYQPERPQAYRFAGGTGPARNQLVTSQGCKNRDVGGSWNSACCP